MCDFWRVLIELEMYFLQAEQTERDQTADSTEEPHYPQCTHSDNVIMQRQSQLAGIIKSGQHGYKHEGTTRLDFDLILCVCVLKRIKPLFSFRYTPMLHADVTGTVTWGYF